MLTGEEKLTLSDGKAITLNDLAEFIFSKKAVSTSSMSWTANERYFFDYQVIFETSAGAFQKDTIDPAIVTYIKYDCYKKRLKRSELMSTVVLLSRVPHGTFYIDEYTRLNSDYTEFEHNGQTWFYNLIRRPIMLTGCNQVKPFTLKTYPSFRDALHDILDKSEITRGTYYNGFVDGTEDIAFQIGATGPNKLYAPFQIDNFGNVYCNSIRTREDSDG